MEAKQAVRLILLDAKLSICIGLILPRQDIFSRITPVLPVLVHLYMAGLVAPDAFGFFHFAGPIGVGDSCRLCHPVVSTGCSLD